MKKKGASELISEILLIVLVVMILAFVLYFLLGYLEERREIINLQNDLNNEELDISDVELNDSLTLTLVLGKGPGGQNITGRSQKNVSYNISITVETNITKNVTNSTIVLIPNSTTVYVSNSTIVNGSNADIVTVNDVSGSMIDDDKIGELKKALKVFINRTLNGTNNQIGLAAYRTGVVGAFCSPLSNNGLALMNLVDTWTASSSTCICCGIDRARTYLAGSTRTKIVIVLSDGAANVNCPYWSPELSGFTTAAGAGGGCTTAANDACDDAINTTKSAFVNEGIITYSIGFGTASDIDETTLRNISIVGNGSYYFSNLTGLEEVFKKIQENISWMEGVNISWNETLNVSWNETVNVSWSELVTQTVNKTIEVEMYAPEVFYDYLKIVFYAGGRSFVQKKDISAVPNPLESKEIDITLDPSWGITTADLTKIEIYTVALTETGKEIISSRPIAVWEKPSLYTSRK